MHFMQEIVELRGRERGRHLPVLARRSVRAFPTLSQGIQDSRAVRSRSMMGVSVPIRRLDMASRILVVDDEPMVRALIGRALTDEGYEVVAVANGRAALEETRGSRAGFDLIITNNYMPGLNGAELVARVRQDFPSLPILHVDDVTRRGRIPPLPSDIPTIYKPFSIAALKAAVLDLLQQGGRN